MQYQNSNNGGCGLLIIWLIGNSLHFNTSSVELHYWCHVTIPLCQRQENENNVIMIFTVLSCWFKIQNEGGCGRGRRCSVRFDRTALPAGQFECQSCHFRSSCEEDVIVTRDRHIDTPHDVENTYTRTTVCSFECNDSVTQDEVHIRLPTYTPIKLNMIILVTCDKRKKGESKKI